MRPRNRWMSRWGTHRARRRAVDSGRSRPVLQRELAPGAGAELDGLVADEDLDGLGPAGAGADPHAVLGERDVDSVAAVVDAELELLDLGRQRRVEPEHLPACPHAGQAALHEVDRTGHRPTV